MRRLSKLLIILLVGSGCGFPLNDSVLIHTKNEDGESLPVFIPKKKYHKSIHEITTFFEDQINKELKDLEPTPKLQDQGARRKAYSSYVDDEATQRLEFGDRLLDHPTTNNWNMDTVFIGLGVNTKIGAGPIFSVGADVLFRIAISRKEGTPLP